MISRLLVLLIASMISCGCSQHCDVRLAEGVYRFEAANGYYDLKLYTDGEGVVETSFGESSRMRWEIIEMDGWDNLKLTLDVEANFILYKITHTKDVIDNGVIDEAWIHRPGIMAPSIKCNQYGLINQVVFDSDTGIIFHRL